MCSYTSRLQPTMMIILCEHHILLLSFQQDTSLHFAAEKGYYDVVTYLVDKGAADVNIRNVEWGVSEIYHCECSVHTVTLKC